MELANQDQVEGLDPKFGAMAAEMGNRARGLPGLTIREKTFLFIAADLCSGGLGFLLATHVQMGGMHGMTLPECRAAIRHLAPHVGYPTAAVALQQLWHNAAVPASGDGDPQLVPVRPGTGGAPVIRMRPLASCVNSTLISRIWSPVSTSGAGATTPISRRANGP